MITHTPTLALQLANFFTSGGTIDVSQSLGDMTAQYDRNGLVIRIDANTVQTMMVGTNTYPNADDLMLSIVSHEAAHYILDMAGTHIFDVTGSEAAYQAHQAQHEALAIANSMIAANEYALATGEVPTLMGYGSESVLRPHLNAFLTTGDFDTLINSLSGLVLDFPWNGTDVNGDGVVNQRDKFSQEFRNWKAENGL
ncbi:hypothetical protein [Luteimonas sp. gir]|uniref:hypothetical protein n=1 Tax=Luteimonas sp. gir TaxID=3127960 RepID=UPI003075E131